MRPRKRLLDTKQVAEFLDKPMSTLANWRWNKAYNLPYIRVGRSIRYAEEDLIAFLESRKVVGDAEGVADLH